MTEEEKKSYIKLLWKLLDSDAFTKAMEEYVQEEYSDGMNWAIEAISANKKADIAEIFERGLELY